MSDDDIKPVLTDRQLMDFGIPDIETGRAIELAVLQADRASRAPSPQGDVRPSGATLRCRRCGEHADIAFNYASTADDLLDRIEVEMRHARKFIASREKMHPIGVEQFDQVYEAVAARSTPAKGGEHG
ncbi:hypothetical protein WKR98_13510 [Pigmentiphaga sp. YJ18]|uniref:hypothetical protein n=1 Tax=Pigmentiphaga sp. YJ18 TaxID=3134907 RepID=UPI003116CE23